MATIIGGTQLARLLLEKPAEEMRVRGHSPGLAVVLVGNDPPSEVCVRSKVTECRKAGIRSAEHRMPNCTSQAARAVTSAAGGVGPMTSARLLGNTLMAMGMNADG